MYLNAHEKIYNALSRSFAPRKHISVSEWADLHRVLSNKTSAKAGAWRTDSNPIQREIMNCFSSRSNVNQVVLMLPIQIGKSEIISNIMAYSMVEAPAPMMLCFPSEVSMTKFNNQKLKPLIEETPLVAEILTTNASRESANTKWFKDFNGGQLYLEHAGSPARLKSTSVKILLVDELDTFAQNLSGADDPVDMLLGRTTSYRSTYKVLFASTPQIKGLSRTEQLYEKSDQRRYYIACPHCNHEQPLIWQNLKWEKGATNVRYVCRECEGDIYEHQKTELIARGRWVAENPEGTLRGYAANCLYYPIGLGIRWADLVVMWLDCQSDPARLKTFINDYLAEAFEDPLMR
jgi:phage terminase large subunit GpA-like protein